MRPLLACTRTLSFLLSGPLLLLFAMLGPTAYVLAESESDKPPAENIDDDAEHAETSAAAVSLFTDSSLFFLQLTRVTRAGDYVLSGTTMSSGVTTPIVVVLSIAGEEIAYESLGDGIGLFQTTKGGLGLIISTGETATMVFAVGNGRHDHSLLLLEAVGLSEQVVLGLATGLLDPDVDDCEASAEVVCESQNQVVCSIDVSNGVRVRGLAHGDGREPLHAGQAVELPA